MSNLIQIRGTSGSGKSWVVRQVMEYLGLFDSKWEDGRKKPMYYLSQDFQVAVVGHYESPCGGGDSIGSAPKILKLVDDIKTLHPRRIIIAESLLLSEDSKWTSVENTHLVIFLTTPLPDCLANIQKRRNEVGNEKPINPKNTTNRVGTIERAAQKLIAKGVNVVFRSSGQAVNEVLKVLNKGK